MKEIIASHTNRNVILFLLIMSIVGVFIALGESYSIPGIGISFHNMLDPFLYLHWYMPMVTEFRVLARFAYFFFWIMNFIALIMIVYAWRTFHEFAARFVILLLLFFLAFDTKNAIEFTNKFHWETPNLFQRGSSHDIMQRLAQKINPKKYQAFLPVPYFCVGTEEYTITIDPDDIFITGCMNFSLQTSLPMMASSMGRTPPEFTKAQLSLFLDGTYSSAIKSKLNEKPLLVLYNSSYYKDTSSFGAWPEVKYQPAITAFKNGKKLISDTSLKEIFTEGDWTLFEIDPKDL